MKQGIILLLCLAASAGNWRSSSRLIDSKPTSRFTVFISDLHLGVGRKSDGQWHNFEDARWAPEFALFLSEINRMGNGRTDLILNGDTFELWQSLEPDCIQKNKNLGCTEAEALHRFQIVAAAHRAELSSIRDFAASGENRVFIVPGNHDSALLFENVAKNVLQIISAPTGRVRVMTEGYWVSRDGKIYAEHGHQIGKDLNKFDNWPSPFISESGRIFLQRPWGEQFVQQFYNDFEAEYPIIDNFLDETQGVRLGFAAEGQRKGTQDIGKFVRFFLTNLSWEQMGSTLGAADEAPDWDIRAIRLQGDRFLVESLPSDDYLRPIAADALANGQLGVSISDLSDEEISNICNLRSALSQRTDQKREATISTCPLRSMGAINQQLFSSRNTVFVQHLEGTLKGLKNAGITDHPFVVFIYSHTHVPDSGFHPFDGSGRKWNPIVVNTGAWQRTVTRAEFEEIREKQKLSQKDALRQLQPEDLPACYSAILIQPYESEPASALMYWKKGANSWSLSGSCGRR